MNSDITIPKTNMGKWKRLQNHQRVLRTQLEGTKIPVTKYRIMFVSKGNCFMTEDNKIIHTNECKCDDEYMEYANR